MRIKNRESGNYCYWHRNYFIFHLHWQSPKASYATYGIPISEGNFSLYAGLENNVDLLLSNFWRSHILQKQTYVHFAITNQINFQ